MSRVGKQPVAVIKGVKVQINATQCLVEGPKGKMDLGIPYGISVEHKDEQLIVERKNNDKKIRSLHGTIRKLLFNMVAGVTSGFKKELSIVGVGYKAQMKGKDLVLNMGFSHPVEMVVPADLKVSTPKPTQIIVEGIDKQKVGEFAAKIRRIYPPEPYKGKGIRYVDEVVRKKLGKALAK